MVMQAIEAKTSTQEQRLVVPGRHTWEQFKTMQAWADRIPGLQITYLDGYIELMTTGEDHEIFKKLIAILLETYFFEQGIRFIPVGNATREAEEHGASFEPDESYYIGNKKAHPDLAIEIVMASGGIGKLEKYKRFKVREVWFWQNNQIAVHALRDADNPEHIHYEQVSQSELLPALDLALFVQCIAITDVFEARATFLSRLRQ